MKTKTVFTFGGLNPYTKEGQLIQVEQNQNKAALFSISYGLQVKNNLTYAQAAKELGQCIFHHLACESVLNNEGA